MKKKSNSESVNERTTSTNDSNGNAVSQTRYYTEGVIKELRINTGAKNGAIKFSLEPSSGYMMELEYKGEKKTCAVLRSEKSAESVFANGVTDLRVGDFIFSIGKELLDYLQPLKINGCHVRLYAESKEVDVRNGGEDAHRPEVEIVEIRIK